MTYNSSEFIVDTLNSIVSQTYKNWEIIICDDCSTDDTCSIIDEWYALNQSSFLFKTLYSTYNQGVTNNLIKGINEAKGEWVKTMAGDDVFNINAIEEFVKEASISEHKFFFSRIELIGYKNDQSLLDYIELSSWLGRNIESVGLQHKILHYYNYVFAPSIFYHKSSYYLVGGLDSEILNLEDWPFFLNVSKNKFLIKFIDIALVKYRNHSSSVQKSPKIIQSYELFRNKYLYKISNKENKILNFNIASRQFKIHEFNFYKYKLQSKVILFAINYIFNKIRKYRY